MIHSGVLSRVAAVGAVVSMVFVVAKRHFIDVDTDSALVVVPVQSIRAPIDGVASITSRRIGEQVESGTVLAVLRNTRGSSLVSELRSRLASARDEAKRLAGQVGDYQMLETGLSAELSKYSSARQRQLRLASEVSGKEYEAALARKSEAAAAFDRAKALNDEGLQPTAGLLVAERDARVAQSASEAEQARSLQAKVLWELAQHGVHVGGNFEQVPLFRQRLDDVRLRLSDARTTLASAQQRVTDLERELAREESRPDSKDDVSLSAGTKGILVSVRAFDGSYVSRGDSLFSMAHCDASYVLGYFTEREYRRFAPGDRVLFSRHDELWKRQGRVVSLLGFVAGVPDSSLYPASTAPTSDRAFGVVALLDEEVGAHKCAVGVSGELKHL